MFRNRRKRWSEKGVLARMLEGLAAQGDESGMLMIDSTHLKVHRTAASLQLKKGAVDVASVEPRAA